VKNREPRLFLRWLSRSAALQCEAEITFLHVGDRQDVFGKAMPGRWTGWPEPLALQGEFSGQPIALVNPYYLAPEYRRIDIYSGVPRLLDIAVRFDDDEECYGWTTANYNSQPPWKNPEWRLAAKNYLVKIDIWAPAARTSAVFRLINDTHISAYRLAPAMPTD
jgi:hypothetical protein